MCVGSVAHGPWLSDITLWAARHHYNILVHRAPPPTLPLPPSTAGRCSFIICEVPVDSPAQGWGHSHHRHLLTPASSPKTPDQATLTGCDFQSPLRVPINFRSSRKPGPLCSDIRPGTAWASHMGILSSNPPGDRYLRHPRCPQNEAELGDNPRHTRFSSKPLCAPQSPYPKASKGCFRRVWKSQ
uniref:Uncharacterized protein n=1 Tax=Bos indicus x Bos taurus TaxID=30522 RepID=A0A4W2CS95_BOBOX